MQPGKPSSVKILWLPEVLLFASAPIFFFLASVLLLAYDSSFYQAVQSHIGIEVSPQIRALDAQLTQFLWKGTLIPGMEVFQEKEILHLYDIYGLLRSFLFAAIASGVVFLISAAAISLFNSRPARTFKRTLIFTLAFYLFAGVTIYFSFDWFFLQFHLWTFANDYWILGENYLLYRLFPPEFFQACLLPFFSLIVFLALLFFLAGLAFSRKPSSKISAS
jgi:hypothetical protein